MWASFKVAIFICTGFLFSIANLHAALAQSWGSVAAGDSGAYGISGNMVSKSTAGNLALNYCRRQGGGDCRVLAYFNQCAAIAFDADVTAYGVGLGSTARIARRKAVNKCNQYGIGCRSAGVSCNDY